MTISYKGQRGVWKRGFSLTLVGLLAVGAGTLASAGVTSAAVTAVTGSAYGWFGNVGLFGGPPVPGGPQPSVTLPAGGSATPITATDPPCGAPGSSTACTPGSSSEAYTRGPAHIYESGKTTVSTGGQPGPTGSVSSSTDIAGCAGSVTNSCNAGQIFAGPFTAGHMASTCTAGDSGVNGSVSITNGVLVTSTFPDGSPKTTAPVPASPAPNTVMAGTNDQTGINGHFKWTFNEQIVNPDGSLTVHAAHEVLGDTTPNSPAHGDLYIGEAKCGVTRASTTTVVASANPSVFGQSVAFTAAVAVTGPGAPTGSVQFQIDGSNLGTPVTLAAGHATSSPISSLSVGSHTVQAVYSGNGVNVAPSTGTLTQKVRKAATTTALTSSKNPAGLADQVMFTATVSALAPGAGTRTGTVQFKNGGANLGSPVAVDSAGQASTTVLGMRLGLGSHAVTAVYSGNGNFSGSTSAVLNETIRAV